MCDACRSQGSVSLSGPAPGYKPANAYVPEIAFVSTGPSSIYHASRQTANSMVGCLVFACVCMCVQEEDQDWDTSKTPQPVQRGEMGMGFMQNLKGGMFYVEGAENMTDEEYRQEIGNRVAEMQAKRRMSGAPMGNKASYDYMDSLKRTSAQEDPQQSNQ